MRLTTNQPRIYLPDVVGRGYGAFWRFTGRYRVCKGSRASKKSTTTALNFIYRMMKYPGANLLVIRKTYRTLRDSCFTQLLWAIHRLQVEAFWSWKESPLEITYKPTGQKIYFRGMDDPLKLTSITAQSGVLCWVWIEEAYEIMNESDFNTLDESIRGECAPPLFKQITLTFNPWNQKHWLKARFFDVEDPDILAITTNYQCNEWLDKQDLRLFERMKATNPRRYAVAGLGNWGIVEGLIYEHWRESPFDPAEISRTGKLESVFGLDFGFTNDPTALFCGLLDIPARRLYVFDELYERGLPNVPSDTVCFPAKLMHGHVDYLIHQGVKTIFYPCMSYNLDEHLGDNHYNCPVVAYYPEVLEGNCPELKATKFIYDYFNLERRKDFYKKFQQTLDHYFPGLDRKAVHEAIDAAYDEYARHMQQLRDKGTEIIAQARREGRRIIVLAGRPYHVDPEVNHGIDQLIIRQGAAVISEDSVSWHEQKFQTSVLNQWTYHSRLYAAAKYCTENPDMDLVQLVSFGCGLDAVTTDETREILQAGSKLYTQLKIDEITNLGAVNIRLRSLFAALEERKEDKK